jgi:NAD(P)-dependent dehydrogenase (short-subunit alcohol dehydrogenase family)
MLKGKKAVITAAASGMGRSGLELFAAAGASVVGIDMNRPGLDDVVGGIRRSGGQAHAVQADLRDAAACAAAIDEAARLLGGIDILWAHAGGPGPEGIEGVAPAAYDDALDVNLRSAFATIGQAVPHMRRAGAGAVVLTSSTAGLVGAHVSPLYAAAKHAVIGLAKSLGMRYAAENIRFNVVCPGPIDTPMFPKFFSEASTPEKAAAYREKVVTAIPMGRLGEAHEVAEAALWLASDKASFVTGAFLAVDGGFTAR